jgi:CubicO group peptidase (beta-lactamase class C family)
MLRQRWVWGVLSVVALLAALAATVLADPDWRRVLSNPPLGRDVLSWSQAERDAGFRMLDRVPFIVRSRSIEAREDAPTWETGAPINIDFDMDRYFTEQHVASVVVIHDGRIRYERYGMGFDRDGRWTSFSVAKSITSTLVGAAIADGAIGSVDDPVIRYIPELTGSAYDGVTIAQLLTMTSGVAWNEDYEDPQSDVARFDAHRAEPGQDPLVSYMSTLQRAHSPGQVWHYSSGETNMIGIVVARATGRPLADYLSEKIWRPFGMEADATWLLDRSGGEIAGCCIQASTRDFARFGQFILDGGRVNGRAVLPDGWVATATTRQVDYGEPGFGYGYQWWTSDDGTFQADGIFGQGIFIDPSRRLVIATNSSWSRALGSEAENQAQREMFRAFQAGIDAERAGGR